jgi:peptidyl-tRNA hydrolase
MELPEIGYLQYVVIPKSLKMSAGKAISQGCHASFMALHEQNIDDNGKMIIEEWKSNGMCVIVLKCDTIEQLLGLEKYCNQWNIPCYLYIDEGLTEKTIFYPTAFATGVITKEQQWIFQKLEMY